MAATTVVEGDDSSVQHETLLGHPVGLYTLFFAEMWERFSYYGMRALLVLYLQKVAFLQYSDTQAYGVLGAYASLVYATGFLGGGFADRLLGQRRAVILGGVLMALGHLTMAIPTTFCLYLALGLLVTGNGFFKPNISTIVGKLYPTGSPRRDGGFTIFYMGVNMGAALSPLICGYVGEKYSWHWGFGLAAVGMLAGLAVFVLPNLLSQIIVMGGAAVTAISLFYLQDSVYQLAVNAAVAVALIIAAVISCIALNRGGIPPTAGQPPNRARLHQKIGPFTTEWLVYLGAIGSVFVFAVLIMKPVLAKTILYSLGVFCFSWLAYEAIRRPKIERQRLVVVLILICFQMVFFSFFEQAASSLNNFADRNIDRVAQNRSIASADVGQEIRFRIPFEADGEIASLPMLSQEQLGMHNDNPEMGRQIDQAIRDAENYKEDSKKLKPEKLVELIAAVNKGGSLNMTSLSALRERAGRDDAPAEAKILNWKVSADNVGMGIGGDEVPASIFQAANAGFILIFGIVLTALWSFLGARGLDPSTPVKFGLGLLQLALGFLAFWYGAQHADSRGMVAVSWLILGYLLHTTGELCLSPVGLSMITKLSPRQIVSTAMGAWFLATGLANNMAAEIAKFTGVSSEGDGPSFIPSPSETVHLYGDVFFQIAKWGIVAAIICFILSPWLSKWMHTEADESRSTTS